MKGLGIDFLKALSLAFASENIKNPMLSLALVKKFELDL